MIDYTYVDRADVTATKKGREGGGRRRRRRRRSGRRILSDLKNGQ